MASLWSNALAMEKSSQSSEKIHGIILKAELPDERSLYFVPSHHFSLLSNFTQEFQNEIFRHSALIVESVSNTAASSREEVEAASPLYSLMHYASHEFIERLDGFVKEDEDRWSLDFDPDIQKKFEDTFGEIAKMTPINLPHFHNIYMMKPGVVFALFARIIEATKHTQCESIKTEIGAVVTYIMGMDDEIANNFMKNSKSIAGVETQLDVIESLSLSTKKLDDIIDDIIEGYDFGLYPTSLDNLHFSFLNQIEKKRLMDEASLAIRNKSWIKQYNELLDRNPDSIIVHGYSHFPGKEGLIHLGQQHGWTWSVFQKDSTYLPFTYAPQESVPFLYNSKPQ